MDLNTGINVTVIAIAVGVPGGLVFSFISDLRGSRTWREFLRYTLAHALHPRIAKAQKEAIAEDFNRQHLHLMDLDDLYYFGSPAQKASWVAPAWLTD